MAIPVNGGGYGSMSIHSVGKLRETLDSLEPVLSCRFVVTFSNLMNLFMPITFAFTKVSGIGYKASVKYVTEGGRNGSPIMLKCPQSEGHHLTFERGLQMKKISPLSVIGGDSRQVLFARHSIGVIQVLDMDKSIKAIYQFTSQGVIDWQVSTLDAMSAQPIIETFTVSHTGLKNIPVGGSALF